MTHCPCISCKRAKPTYNVIFRKLDLQLPEILHPKWPYACNYRRREGSGNLWGCLSYVMRLF